MKSRINNQYLNKSGLCIALIFLFVGVIKAQNEYPINDPRNPNCPCHKYQKLAEEEYKKLLGKNNTIKDMPLELVINQKVDNSNTNKTKLNKHNGISDDSQGDLKKINKDKHNDVSDLVLNKLNNTISESINAQGKINEQKTVWANNVQKNERTDGTLRSPQYTTTKRWKGKRKRHTSFHKQMKRIFYVGGWDIWKRNRITSACYNWR